METDPVHVTTHKKIACLSISVFFNYGGKYDFEHFKHHLDISDQVS